MTQKEETIIPSIKTDKAIELFKRQMAKIDLLLTLRFDNPEVNKWKNFTEQLIIKTFGKPHGNLSNYYDTLRGGPISFNMSDYDIQKNFVNGLNGCKKLLEGFIEQLEAFSENETFNDIKDINKIQLGKTFIVHGHNEQFKTELSSILKNLGFEPIILHEQANQGLTIIEKLEKYSDVGFAFILLTPDDIGNTKGQENNPLPRARQNVVFEFGLFAGKLGRNRVCCLHAGDVELPSDLHGLVYLPFKNSINEIQLNIVKELKAAGYNIQI